LSFPKTCSRRFDLAHDAVVEKFILAFPATKRKMILEQAKVMLPKLLAGCALALVSVKCATMVATRFIR
jgi:hypothetical protein